MTTATNTPPSSKKPTKKGPTWVSAISMIIFFTLAVGAGLYYTYVVNLQEYFIDRNFRLLTLHQSLLTAKLLSYQKVFDSAGKNKSKIDRFRSQKTSMTCEDSDKNEGIKQIIAPICKDPILFDEVINFGNQKIKERFIVNESRESGGVLKLSYTNGLEIRAKVKVADLVKQYKLSSESLVFDDLIVATQDGYVLYQENKSLIQFSRIDQLLQSSPSDIETPKDTDQPTAEDEKEGAKAQGAPHKNNNQDKDSLDFSSHLPALQTKEVGGIAYRVFAEGISLPSTTLNAQTDSLIILGLVNSSRFLNESLSISYTYLLGIIFGITGLFLAAPFLKLKIMGPKDHLTLLDVSLLLLSMFVGMAFVVFFLLDLKAYDQLTDERDVNLKEIAKKLEGQMKIEMGRALEQLIHLNETLVSQTKAHRNIIAREDEVRSDIFGRSCANQADAETRSTCPPFLNEKLAPFPNLSLVAWMDKNGMQKIKWSTGKTVTTRISIQDRPYFKNVKEGNSFRYADYNYYLEPINSRTTGESKEILSLAVNQKEDKPLRDLPVVAMGVRLPTFVKAVLPPGTGYAIINEKGHVLFHKDSSRRLRESFFDETDQNRKIRSLVFARQSGFVSGPYWGWDHRFYLHQLKVVPWTLIVYADKKWLNTLNLEVLSVSVFLFMCYAGVVLVVILFGLILCRSLLLGKAAWLWPQAKCHWHYQSICLVNVGLLTLYVGGLWQHEFLGQREEDVTFFWALLFPVLSIILTSVILKMEPNRKGQHQEDLRRYRISYPLMVMTGILLFSILPASAIFKLSFDHEVRALDKYSQSSLVQSLEERQTELTNLGIESRVDVPDGPTGVPCPRATTTSAPKSEPLHGGTVLTLGRHHVCIRDGIILQENWNDSKSYFDGIYGSIRERLIFDRISENFTGFLRKFGATSFSEKESTASPANTPGKAKKNPQLVGHFPFKTAHSPQQDSERKAVTISTDPLVFGWDLPLWAFLFGVGVLLVRGGWEDLQHLFRSWRGFMVKASPPKRLLLFMVAGLILLGLITQIFGFLKILVLGFLLIVGGVVFYVLLYGLPVFILKRVFLLNFDKPFTPTRDALDRLLSHEDSSLTHLLILGPSDSEKARLIQGRPGWQIIDLHELHPEARWFKVPIIADALKDPETQGVAISHFEHLLGSVPYDQKKIELVEKLHDRGVKICILSSVDPLRLPLQTGDQELSSDIKEQWNQKTFSLRWANMFQSFSIVYAGTYNWGGEKEECYTDIKNKTLRGVLEQECGTNPHLRNVGHILKVRHAPTIGETESIQETEKFLQEKELIQEVFDLAEPYYRSIWANCSAEERLALFHLAKYRFLHSDNPSLRLLLKQGLIVLAPDLRIMNESFRRFLLNVGEKEEIATLEKEGTGSVWKAVSRPLGMVLIVLVVFLFATQEQLRSEAMAFLSLIPVTVPILLRFFDNFKAKKAVAAA